MEQTENSYAYKCHRSLNPLNFWKLCQQLHPVVILVPVGFASLSESSILFLAREDLERQTIREGAEKLRESFYSAKKSVIFQLFLNCWHSSKVNVDTLVYYVSRFGLVLVRLHKWAAWTPCLVPGLWLRNPILWTQPSFGARLWVEY